MVTYKSNSYHYITTFTVTSDAPPRWGKKSTEES